jgi:hypothetical protein
MTTCGWGGGESCIGGEILNFDVDVGWGEC